MGSNLVTKNTIIIDDTKQGWIVCFKLHVNESKVLYWYLDFLGYQFDVEHINILTRLSGIVCYKVL